MRLSNSQLKLIAFLNLIIIALLTGAVFVVAHFRLENEENLPVYSRIRTGTISLNPNLGWELELLGSLDEQAVFSYIYNETIFVFGNSLSSDFDFERPCIFLAKIDTLGKLNENSLFYYGGAEDKLIDAQISNDGFILAIEGAKPYLLVINLDGEIVKTVDNFTTNFEKIATFIPYLDGWLLFTRPYNISRSTYGLRCIFFNFNLNFMFSNLASELFSLEYFEIVLSSNGAIAFCNATNGMGVIFPAVVEFFLTSSAKVTIIESHAGKAVGFTVFDGQYMLTTAFGGSSFLKLNAKFEVTDVIPIGLNTPTFFIDDDNGFYAVFSPTTTYIYNSDLVKTSTLIGYNPNDYKYTLNSVIFSSQDIDNKLSVELFYNGQITKLASLQTGNSPTIILNQNSVFAIYHKSGNIQISSLRPL